MANQTGQSTHKLVILDSTTLGDISLKPLTTGFEHLSCYEMTTRDQIMERIAAADIVVSNKVVIDEAVMARARNLKLICVAATGTNNVDLEAAKKQNVTVVNVPGYSTPAVVSHTFSMYFHLAHHNLYHQQYTSQKQWCDSPIFTHLERPFHEMAGRVWGIVGLGNIGRAVADVAAAFGCKVIYHSTSGKNTNGPWPHHSLTDLLQTADVISLHAPLYEKTRNLITYERMQQMKPTAILLNTSRGGMVNEADLAKALDEGLIAGAGLDVLEQEPPDRNNPLWQLANPERLLVTPHIAGLSVESRQRLVAAVRENIDAWCAGKPQNVVSG